MSGHKVVCVALVLSAAIFSQALAQQSMPKTLQELNAEFERKEAESKKHPRPGFQETMLAPVNQSMTDLLNSGWSIVGGALAVGFTLRDKANKWVVCEVDDGNMYGRHPGSRCVALN